MNSTWEKTDKRWLLTGVLVIVGVAAGLVVGRWWPSGGDAATQAAVDANDDPHAGHDHAGHDEGSSLELSPQAQKNIGLKTAQIKLQPFDKTVSIPALVVERKGRSQVEVTALLGGRVTRVYPIQGEAVEPGQPLFDLRLTHEELVNAQSELMRSAEELDVVMRDIKRLESVSAISPKTIRDRKYEQQKLEAIINAQQQSLELHGLSEEQVQSILEDRILLKGLTVNVPSFPPNGHDGEPDHPFHIQELNVKPGQYVDAGQRLCMLADHHELFIEGKAFEQDIDWLTESAKKDRKVSATLMLPGRETERVGDLRIFRQSDVVELASRAYHFYLRLPNHIVRDEKNEADGHRFVVWKYKPGQRMQIHVTTDHWENRIVLPVEAVAQEGVETFIFEQNGDHFDRVPVHVEYRDRNWVVIENDPKLIGSTVATSSAHQMQMAIKNKAGGGVDPHAGHSH